MPGAPVRFRAFRLFAALLCASYAIAAAAQWAWRDESGRLVFSDRPPPSSVKPNQIVRQPAAAIPALPVPAGEMKGEGIKAELAAPPRNATPSAPPTLAERDMDYRKRQQERGEAEKKASEEQAQKQQRAQDCERARGYLRSLEDGRRIARTDTQGNQVVLDDLAREAELQRVRERVARDCN